MRLKRTIMIRETSKHSAHTLTDGSPADTRSNLRTVPSAITPTPLLLPLEPTPLPVASPESEPLDVPEGGAWNQSGEETDRGAEIAATGGLRTDGLQAPENSTDACAVFERLLEAARLDIPGFGPLQGGLQGLLGVREAGVAVSVDGWAGAPGSVLPLTEERNDSGRNPPRKKLPTRRKGAAATTLVEGIPPERQRERDAGIAASNEQNSAQQVPDRVEFGSSNPELIPKAQQMESGRVCANGESNLAAEQNGKKRDPEGQLERAQSQKEAMERAYESCFGPESGGMEVSVDGVGPSEGEPKILTSTSSLLRNLESFKPEDDRFFYDGTPSIQQF
jgi:hypothetical protein